MNQFFYDLKFTPIFYWVIPLLPSHSHNQLTQLTVIQNQMFSSLSTKSQQDLRTSGLADCTFRFFNIFIIFIYSMFLQCHECLRYGGLLGIPVTLSIFPFLSLCHNSQFTSHWVIPFSIATVESRPKGLFYERPGKCSNQSRGTWWCIVGVEKWVV